MVRCLQEKSWPNWYPSTVPCICKRLLGAEQVSLAQILFFFLFMEMVLVGIAWRAVRDEEFCNVSRLKPQKTLKWQKGSFNCNKVGKTQQGDFSSSWDELCSSLEWSWLDSEQDGEQCSSVAWFLMVQFLRTQNQPLHSGHGRINKLCYCYLSFATTFVIKFLRKSVFPCKGSQLPCTSSTTPWSIGAYFTLEFSLVCLYFGDTVLLSEICRHMSQNWVPITIFRSSEKCDLIQRSVKKFSVAMERRGAQHLWNIICLEESKYRF